MDKIESIIDRFIDFLISPKFDGIMIAVCVFAAFYLCVHVGAWYLGL